MKTLIQKNKCKISKWNNECEFDIKFLGKEKTKIYEIGGFEEGGIEFEVELTEKPNTNVFKYKIQHKNLDFFYQPALTQKEIDEGANRPENVIGSYAVYHSTKKNHIQGQTNYKTGKAFHIFRPEIIDANGNKVWGELDIKGNTLTITIDQNWLDNAIYPVIVDPTFGYTTMGSSKNRITVFSSSRSRRIGNSYAMSENGDLDSVTVGMATLSTGPDTTDVSVFVNEKDGGGTDSHTEISTAEKTSQEFTTTSIWFTFSGMSGTLESGKDYLLSASGNVINIDGSTSDITVLYDSISATHYAEE